MPDTSNQVGPRDATIVEIFSICRSRSAEILRTGSSGCHNADRTCQVTEISGERNVVDVLGVDLKPVAQITAETKVRYLVRTGHTRLHLMARMVQVTTFVGDLVHLRARTNEAHLSADHIEQLWQLVETEAAKNPPDSCVARIIFGFVVRTAISSDRNICLALTTVVAHRAELVDHKCPLALADALLTIENTLAQLETNHRSNYKKQGAEHRQNDQRAHQVKGPFQASFVGGSAAHKVKVLNDRRGLFCGSNHFELAHYLQSSLKPSRSVKAPPLFTVFECSEVIIGNAIPTQGSWIKEGQTAYVRYGP